MGFDLLNPWMLLGLAGMALPVLAHLLSKRKYDIVQWGAMQFLELGKKTRRRVRLEELLLMLLRIGMIALVALALARPWASGGIFSSLSNATNRDVALVVDGSYSMGWQGGDVTPHAAAIQWSHHFLEQLLPGDNIAILDMRDDVRPVIDPGTGNFDSVREQLTHLPKPSGTANEPVALTRAVQLLSQGTNVAREVVLLTDSQAVGWSPDDEFLWARFDDLLQQQTVKPRVWVVDVSDPANIGTDVNLSVDPLVLTRDVTVPDFPIRVRTMIRQSSGATAEHQVHVEINGEPLHDTARSVRLTPGGAAPFEFEHRFPNAGSYLVTVRVTADQLPGDDASHAAVTVSPGMPVLLVDGDPQTPVTSSETYFMKTAFASSRDEARWVDATVVSWRDFSRDSLQGQQAVVLANVRRMTTEQAGALADFAKDGGGIIIAPGDRIDANEWNKLAETEAGAWIPAEFEKIEQSPDADEPVTIDGDSLTGAWLERFKTESAVDFPSARIGQWWTIHRFAREEDPLRNDESSEVIGKLTNAAPLMILNRHGRGQVLQLAVSLDADWTTLPTKNDFVPFLHEMSFELAGGGSSHNVQVGRPLIASLAKGERGENFEFHGPGETVFAATSGGDADRPLARLDQTTLPGVYRLQKKDAKDARAPYFVVNTDRTESDLTPLSVEQRQAITEGERLSFIRETDELQAAMFSDVSPTEMWRFLMLGLLLFLVFELLMTRRLVKGGHEAIDFEELE